MKFLLTNKLSIMSIKKFKKYHWIQNKKIHDFLTSERKKGLPTSNLTNKQTFNYGHKKLQEIALDLAQENTKLWHSDRNKVITNEVSE